MAGKIKRVTSPEVPEPPPETWSNCLVVGEQVWIAGMVSGYADGVIAGGEDEYRQSKLIFAKIRHLMTAAGGAMADIVKITVFVTDIRRREEVWRARAEFFTGDFPTSTLVEVSALARPGLKVEIEAVGVIGASKA